MARNEPPAWPQATNPYNAGDGGRGAARGKWTRKRVLVPAAAVLFLTGLVIGAAGSGTDPDTRTVAAAAAPTVTETATATVTATPPPAEPTVTATVTESAEPAPTVTVTKTRTVHVTARPAAPRAATGSGGSDGGGAGGGSAYYANCTAARAAGVTPLYRGQPGYDNHLDRDGDGVACE
ncbi:excalibur calcium-binding domain-containing protein [Streptomyces tremellae]|uniref:Excalibur calcium-binding domain-containing protein n=1 Tax=Streptomyces tremellae TaxID=1124239 RepID=A0ABP7FZD9_9ACTN